MANADKRVNLRMSEEQFDALQAKFEASKMKSMTSFILDSILTPSKEVATKVPKKSVSGKMLAPKKPMTLEEEYNAGVLLD